MAIIRRFMCCSDTRKGSAFSAFYSLAISAIGLTWYLVRYISMGRIDDALEFRAITFAAFGVYCMTIICSLIMIPGIFLDQRYMFCPWLLVITLVLLFEVGAIGLLTTAHLQIDKVLSTWEITGVVLYLLRTVMNVYCLICVISQYQELSEGRGSYDYLYKNRRTQLPDSNTDSSLVAFALPPPPYSPEDPMKEFAPPAYSNYVAISPDRVQSPAIGHDSGSVASGAGPRARCSGADSVLYCTRTHQIEISHPNPVYETGDVDETVCDIGVFNNDTIVAVTHVFSGAATSDTGSSDGVLLGGESHEVTSETNSDVHAFSDEAVNKTISDEAVNKTISDEAANQKSIYMDVSNADGTANDMCVDTTLTLPSHSSGHNDIPNRTDR